jgi:hypothetical protein
VEYRQKSGVKTMTRILLNRAITTRLLAISGLARLLKGKLIPLLPLTRILRVV